MNNEHISQQSTPLARRFLKMTWACPWFIAMFGLLGWYGGNRKLLFHNFSVFLIFEMECESFSLHYLLSGTSLHWRVVLMLKKIKAKPVIDVTSERLTLQVVLSQLQNHQQSYLRSPQLPTGYVEALRRSWFWWWGPFASPTSNGLAVAAPLF